MPLRFAICFAAIALAGCGSRSFVMPTRDGALLMTGSSARLAHGAEERDRLVQDAQVYCRRHGKSATVTASSVTDAKPGTLGAPGQLARATIKFHCR